MNKKITVYLGIMALLGIISLNAQVSDLSKVLVLNKQPLTNARIVLASQTAITFACDQGLVKVEYQFLPPEFRYYQKNAKAPISRTETAKPNNNVAPRPNSPTANKNIKSTNKEKSAVDLAKEKESRENAKINLRQKIEKCERVIYEYERQSSFTSKVLISESKYQLAKAELDEAKRKLEELERLN